MPALRLPEPALLRPVPARLRPELLCPEPAQQKLVTNTEEPIDVASKEPPQSRIVDLSPDDTDAAPATNSAGNAAAAAPVPDTAAP
ncbi:MAG: hypothetical protein E5W06_30370, partial [Mesorhizobium sp.]